MKGLAVCAALAALGCNVRIGYTGIDASTIDASPGPDAPPDAQVCDADCQLAATFPLVVTYTPEKQSSERAQYTMGGELISPELEFYFDEANGSFEEREGGACLPVQDNPDLVHVNIKASNKDLVSCTVMATWDNAPFPCPQVLVDAVNSDEGFEVVLNTDAFETNPDDLCAFLADPHFPYDSAAWWEMTFETDAAQVTKRLRLHKRSLN